MNVKIIFETQTGSTQYVAELMQKDLQKVGHQVTLHSVKYDGSTPDLNGIDAVIFGAPTYDDGHLEKLMKTFITDYQVDLSAYKVAVFGLGNRSYPQFCKAADFLEKWVADRNGTLLIPTLRLHTFEDIDRLTPITDWTVQLIAKLV